MEIIPYQPTDREEVQRLKDAVFQRVYLQASRPWKPSLQVESLERDCVRLVVRAEKLVGYGAAYRLDESHFRLQLLVDPARWRQGIGTGLLQHLESKIEQQGGRYIQARLLESMPAGLDFALARGFGEIHRMRGMTLLAADFDDRAGRAMERRLQAAGFSLTTFRAETEADRAPLDGLVPLQLAGQDGWAQPDPTQAVDNSPAQLRDLFADLTALDRFFIAVYNGQYVGYTSLVDTRTAVHPDFRNRGLACFLKTRALQQAIASGEERWATCTASTAMQRVNLQLGYKFNGVAEVRLVKFL